MYHMRTCKNFDVLHNWGNNINFGERVAKTPLHDAFAAVVRDRRRELGINQGELGELSGVNRSYIAKIETSKNQPTITVIFALAKGLSLTPQELIAETETRLKYLPRRG
jgi:DNA-binding XRE family transcriptional regulator